MNDVRLPKVEKVQVCLRVKEVAEEKGVSIADLSFGTRLSRQYIHKIWHNDIKGVSLDTLGKIAYVLNVPVRELFTEDAKNGTNVVESDEEEITLPVVTSPIKAFSSPRASLRKAA